MLVDIDNGFINIPVEYLETHGIHPGDTDSPPFLRWVRERVGLARRYYHEVHAACPIWTIYVELPDSVGASLPALIHN